MTDEFILERLKKWVPLFYGNDKIPYASKGVNDEYWFGYTDGGVKIKVNKVTKPVAIFLVLGNIEFLKYMKENNISKNEFFDTLTNDYLKPIKRRRMK